MGYDARYSQVYVYASIFVYFYVFGNPPIIPKPQIGRSLGGATIYIYIFIFVENMRTSPFHLFSFEATATVHIVVIPDISAAQSSKLPAAFERKSVRSGSSHDGYPSDPQWGMVSSHEY